MMADVQTGAYFEGLEAGKAESATEIETIKAELKEAREIIKSFHLDNMDYSVRNNLSGHNSHNLCWARRFLGMKEKMSIADARTYLNMEEANG
jgi:hypothetical protein